MTIARVASPTGIHRTIGIAGLSDVGDVHARVALLGGRNQYAIAAYRNAGSTGKRTLVAVLNLASCGTTGISTLALIALLTGLHDAITTDSFFADACLTGHARTGGVLRFAV
jgi:hypothetical protein